MRRATRDIPRHASARSPKSIVSPTKCSRFTGYWFFAWTRPLKRVIAETKVDNLGRKYQSLLSANIDVAYSFSAPSSSSNHRDGRWEYLDGVHYSCAVHGRQLCLHGASNALPSRHGSGLHQRRQTRSRQSLTAGGVHGLRNSLYTPTYMIKLWVGQHDDTEWSLYRSP